MTPAKAVQEVAGAKPCPAPQETNLDQGDNNFLPFIVQESNRHCVHNHLPDRQKAPMGRQEGGVSGNSAKQRKRAPMCTVEERGRHRGEMSAQDHSWQGPHGGTVRAHLYTPVTAAHVSAKQRESRGML